MTDIHLCRTGLLTLCGDGGVRLWETLGQPSPAGLIGCGCGCSAGEALFQRLRRVAVDFDRRLRAGLSEQDVATLGVLLDRLRDNVA